MFPWKVLAVFLTRPPGHAAVEQEGLGPAVLRQPAGPGRRPRLAAAGRQPPAGAAAARPGLRVARPREQGPGLQDPQPLLRPLNLSHPTVPKYLKN